LPASQTNQDVGLPGENPVPSGARDCSFTPEI
jgi:hypothetical protein